MKKLILALISILTVALGVSAQSHDVHFRFGVRTGLDISKYTAFNTEKAKCGAGFYDGCFVNIGFGDSFYVEPGV